MRPCVVPNTCIREGNEMKYHDLPSLAACRDDINDAPLDAVKHMG